MYMFMYCHHDGSFANRMEISVLQTKNIYWPIKPCLSIQIWIFKFSYIYIYIHIFYSKQCQTTMNSFLTKRVRTDSPDGPLTDLW